MLETCVSSTTSPFLSPSTPGSRVPSLNVIAAVGYYSDTSTFYWYINISIDPKKKNITYLGGGGIVAIAVVGVSLLFESSENLLKFVQSPTSRDLVDFSLTLRKFNFTMTLTQMTTSSFEP